MKKASTHARGLGTCWTSSCGESSEALLFSVACRDFLLPREVELAHRIAVELHGALGDQTASLACREAEGVGQQGRQMEGISRWERVFRHVLGEALFAYDAIEVLLGLAGRLLPVRTRDDEAGERELQHGHELRRGKLAPDRRRRGRRLPEATGQPRL